MTKQRYVLVGLGLLAAIALPIVIISLVNGEFQSNLRIGFVGSNYGDHMNYSYTRFNGREVNRVNVDGSDVLILQYDVNVELGSLELRVLDDLDEVIWHERYEQAINDQAQIDVTGSDRVRLEVIGHDTEGHFDLSWTTD